VIDLANPSLGSRVNLPEVAEGIGLPDPVFSIAAVFQGGMGVCVKLRHEATGRDFALKAIKPAFIGEANSWSRYTDELRHWLTFSACDGVAEALFIARINEIPCMIGTWYPGGSLRSRVREIAPSLAYSTIIRTARTLEWVLTNHHAIHRDLKPDNILLADNGESLVGDWGIARLIGDKIREAYRCASGAGSDAIRTQVGTMIGTVSYAAPEQILGLPSIDHRADIYSLGCLLHELETGQRPFLGSTYQEIARLQLEAVAPKLGGLLRRTRLGLEDVTHRCLLKDPDARYQTYADLIADVERASRKRRFNVSPYKPQSRGRRPRVGQGEFTRNVAPHLEHNEKGFGVVELEEIAPYLDEAMALMALGEYEKAAAILAPFYIVELCKAIAHWGPVHAVAVNYALCLSATSADQLPALALMASVKDAEPKPAEYFINLSLLRLRHFDFPEAEAVASAGLRLYPNDGDLIGNLVVAYTHQKKWSSALPAARRCLQLARSHAALLQTAVLLLAIGSDEIENWPAAVAYFKESVALSTEASALSPRHVATRLNRAQALQKLFRLDEASAECQEAFRLSERKPEFGACVALCAELLVDVRSFDECLSFCEQWKGQPVDRIAALRLRRTHMKVIVDHYMVGKLKDGSPVVVIPAVDFFRTQAELPEPDPEDLLYHARISEWLGDLETAWKTMDRLLASRPNDWRAACQWAEFLVRAGKPQVALEWADIAVALAPFRPEPLDVLANVCQAAGDAKRAAETKARAEAVYERRKQLAL
jgi:serine/threonine protein kinase/tetratricopeptide (TPR) repeat protein